MIYALARRESVLRKEIILSEAVAEEENRPGKKATIETRGTMVKTSCFLLLWVDIHLFISFHFKIKMESWFITYFVFSISRIIARS